MNDVIIYYHGGSTIDFSIDSIDIYRNSTKQGNSYSGFYMFGVEKRDKAFCYADMAESRLGIKNAGVSRIEISSKAKIGQVQGQLGKIDRMTKEELDYYKNQGYDIITGKSYDGQQYILLNKNVIVSMNFLSIDKRDLSIEEEMLSTNTRHL